MDLQRWEHFVLAQRCCEGSISNLVRMLMPDAEIKKQEQDRLQTIAFLRRALTHLENDAVKNEE